MRARALGVLALVLFVALATWMAVATPPRPPLKTRLVSLEDGEGTPPVRELCETCHATIRDAGKHPGALLVAHPAAMGCTSCHGGIPEELSMLAHERPSLVDRNCARCHGERIVTSDAARRADVAKITAAYQRGLAVYRDLRCGACHDADAQEPRPAAPLADIDAKLKPEWAIAWLKDPRAIAPHTTMPNAWAIPRDPNTKTRIEGEALSAFVARRDSEVIAVAAWMWSQPARAKKKNPDARSLRDESLNRANVPGASADEGAHLYAALACAACHVEGASKSDARDRAPSLDDEGRKTNEDWLALYLAAPERVDAHGKMPSFRLDAREAASLAKFLVTKKKESPLAATADEVKNATQTPGWSTPVQCNVGAPSEMSRADCGQLLAVRYGCTRCHAGGGSPAPVKTSLVEFLARSPADIARQYQAAGSTRDELLAAAMRSPPLERPSATMPDYDLSGTEVAALSVFIDASFRPKPPRGFVVEHGEDEKLAARGESLFHELSCTACHRMGEGEPAIGTLLGEKGRARWMPPSLEHESERARPEWVFSFLLRPGALGVRPAFHPEWVYGKLPPLESLAPRMPTFALDNADATALARWLGRTDSAPFPYSEPKPRAIAPDERIQAFELLNRGDAQTRCTACHYAGDPPVERMKDETQLVAPSLSTVQTRRRMEWVTPFLLTHDPAKKPLNEKEAELVTSLLYSLPEKARLPKPGEEARAPVP